MNNLSTSKLTTKLSLAALLCGLGASAVQATPLGLTLQPEPDILSSFLSVSYDDASDMLTVTGGADTLKLGGDQAITGGSFSLDAKIDSTGALVSGSLSIGGSVGAYTGPTLLTGNLSGFGYNTSGTLEFLFTVTGGDLSGQYGTTGGIILSQVLDWTAAPLGGFVGDFTGDGMALSDTAKTSTGVPDAGNSVALLGVSLAAMVAGRRFNVKVVTFKR